MRSIFVSPKADDIVLPAQTPYSVEFIEGKPVREAFQTLTATIAVFWVGSYLRQAPALIRDDITDQELVIAFTLYVKNNFSGEIRDILLENIDFIDKMQDFT